MNFAKRMLALALAVLMVLAMAGCSNNQLSKADDGVVASCGDRTMNGALYMRFLLDAYTLADTYKDDQNAMVLDTTVEDIPAGEWIRNTAREDISRYFACMNKFDETEMEFTDEDQAYVDSYAANMMEQYPHLFEANGVDLQALKEYYAYNIKSMALFDYYYAEGGEKEVAQDELKDEMRSLYNLTKVMIFDKPLTTVDADGNVTQPTEAEVAEAEAKARAYYDRALAGEDFEQLIIEWELEYFGEDNIDHTHETDGSHDLVTVVGSSEVPEAYLKVMDNAAYGEPQFIEDADVYYVATRYDIAETPTTFANYSSTVLLSLRSEDFRAMTDEWVAAEKIDINDKLLEQFTPESIAENLGMTN